MTKAKTPHRIYGFNTGVGDLAQTESEDPGQELQRSILLSHACGVGETLSREATRASMFCRLASLALGNSGVSPELLQFIATLLNKDICPVVKARGSTGSGDMPLMAQIFLIVLGEGDALYKGQMMSAAQALSKAGVDTLPSLGGREGLALINSNAGTVGRTCLIGQRAISLIHHALAAASLNLEARMCSSAAFRKENQHAKPIWGQAVAARAVESLVSGSEFISYEYDDKNKRFLQDPVAYRTIPQSVGTLIDALGDTLEILTLELNSVTDNPLIFPDEELRVVGSGNFLCARLASSIDHLAIAIENTIATSEARLSFLTSNKHSEGLPQYLVMEGAGMNGFMIPNYVAQSLLTEIQALCSPRSIYSHSVANDWENVSTNAYNAALNLERIIELSFDVLAIEFLLSVQALTLRQQLHPELSTGEGTSQLLALIRAEASAKGISFPIVSDCYMGKLVDFFSGLLRSEKIHHLCAEVVRPIFDPDGFKNFVATSRSAVADLYRETP